MTIKTLQDLKNDLKKALADFDAEAERIGLKPKRPEPVPDICECGHVIEDHIGYLCVAEVHGEPRRCECSGFKPMEPPEVDPFTTVEYYMRDRKGTWTGD